MRHAIQASQSTTSFGCTTDAGSVPVVGGEAWVVPFEPGGPAWITATAPEIRVVDRRAARTRAFAAAGTR